MKLIIVESPTKSSTIQKFLGSDYKVISSYGHVRDLPKSKLGVEIENDFKPKYIIPLRTRKTISLLKKEGEKANSIILATDEDREGEAIAWHLTQVLNLDGEKPHQRIVFHEITKQAITKALQKPRKIDMDLVDSQQTRRILDRIVGYQLSPFLWKKVARGLSAGRVQSVAVRLVADREKEIKSFVPQEYWTIEALFKKKNKEFGSVLIKKDGKLITRLGIKSKKDANKIVKDLNGADYKVLKIKKQEVKRNPPPPFTTSSLQREVWIRFHWPAKMTMGIAQNLYEKGFITYHRTDSLNLSNLSLGVAKKFIIKNYGEKYWAGFLRKYKAKKRAQEAHEAIRPTYPNKVPEETKSELKINQFRLYRLIWQRFIASQMNQAVFDSTTVDISAKRDKKQNAGYIFRSTGQILKFDGFLRVYPIKYKEAELPSLKLKEVLELIKLIPSQHFTKPPARYNEASLIKELEKNGIGRPSTYAPILSTVQERNYIEKDEQKRFRPTEIGSVVNNLLVTHFPKIVDIGFTAQMEEDLDKVAEGKKKWVKILRDFYTPFKDNLEEKYKEISKEDIAVETTQKTCPKCGSQVLIRLGRYGKFYGCSNFPKCKYTKSLEKEGPKIKCPNCKKGEIVEKRTKKRKIFYGCSRWPKCDFALWDKPTNKKCPKCNSLLIQTKRGQIKCSNKECDYVEK